MPTRAFIPFDAFALAAVASELRHTALPSRVQKIYQPTSSELVITLFGAGGAHTLFLSANGQSARVHLTQIRRENPTNPPAFCQVCRKHLDGTFLEGAEMPRFDRVLHLIFRGVDGERFRIIAELMGRNSNLILVSGGGLVRGSIRSAPFGSTRSLRPGTPYADPPGYGEKRDPLTIKADDAVWETRPTGGNGNKIAAWFSETFSGIAPFATYELLDRATDIVQETPALPRAFVRLMGDVKAERFTPHWVGGSLNGDGVYTRGVWPFVPYSAPPALRFARPGGISLALDTFYQTASELQARESASGNLRKILTREIAYREKEAASMEATLREGHRAELHEQTANNLLAQLHLAQKGQASATIADLYDTTGENKEVTVALDPKKSPQENAQAYFTRAKKARDAQIWAQSRADGLRPELEELRRIAQSLADENDAPTLAQIEHLRNDTAAIVGEPRMNAASNSEAQTGASENKNEKPWAGHKVRAYTLDGYELLIGETAEANDFLTTRVAQPADWWFHVRGGPGAHGVLRTNNQPARVPDGVMRRAAQAVAARSGTAVKHAGTVAVDVIEKRHVRKPRGAKPGLVTYSMGRERVLDVTPALP